MVFALAFLIRRYKNNYLRISYQSIHQTAVGMPLASCVRLSCIEVMAVVAGKCRSLLLQNDGLMTLRRFERVFLDIRGFTLAEMMAVTGVFAILVVVAVPNYLAFQPNMRLNGASREVLSKLMWARSKAVVENTSYDVTFPTDHTIEIRKAGVLIQTVDIETEYAGVTFSKSGDDPAFDSRGTAGGATTITITGSSGSKTVTVNAAGKVRIN